MLDDEVMFAPSDRDESRRRPVRRLLGTYPLGCHHPYPDDQLTEDGRTWVVSTIARQGQVWEAYGYEVP